MAPLAPRSTRWVLPIANVGSDLSSIRAATAPLTARPTAHRQHGNDATLRELPCLSARNRTETSYDVFSKTLQNAVPLPESNAKVSSISGSGRAAGKPTFVADWALIPASPRTPDTLNDIKKRHRNRPKIGEQTTHWGMHDVSYPGPGRGYGRKNDCGDNVAQNFKAGQKLGVEEYRNKCGEAVYQTTSQQPLGKGWVRGYKLPPGHFETHFPGFGLPIKRSTDAKESIFPRGYEPDPEEVRKRYIRTHFSFEASEPVCRNYEWPEKVTECPKHAYGIIQGSYDSDNNGLGVKRVLNTFDQTRIVDRSLAEFLQRDQFGTTRAIVLPKPPVEDDHAFGMPTERGTEDAASLVSTCCENGPDENLGRCTLVGRRNFVTTRPLGTPTVRTDLMPPPRYKRSVANATNFGDDDNARGLVAPGKMQRLNLVDSDFEERLGPDEMKALLHNSGCVVSDEDFDVIFQTAQEIHGDDEDLVSVQAIIRSFAGQCVDER